MNAFALRRLGCRARPIVGGNSLRASSLLGRFSVSFRPFGVRHNSQYIIETTAEAQAFLSHIQSLPKDVVFACDTEVDIDISNESPVGNGLVTCVSIYSLPAATSSKRGKTKGKASTSQSELKQEPEKNYFAGDGVWIDLLDGEAGVFDVVKAFMESEDVNKVWHNYSFDRHVLQNTGINCRGFKGDTMHMARLVDTSLDKADADGGLGYSLEGLSETFLKTTKKTSMKKLFGKPVLKRDGTPGKTTELPTIPEIQRDAQSRGEWIRYSCIDAKCTYELYEYFRDRLRDTLWQSDEVVGQNKSMFEFYEKYLVPFGQVLINIEREGFQLDMDFLKKIETQAAADEEKALVEFKLAMKACGAFENDEDALAFNPSSTSQKAMLLFAKNGKLKMKNGEEVNAVFKTENTSGYVEPGRKKPLKWRDAKVLGLGLKASKWSATGAPSTSTAIMTELVGDPENGKWGKAYKAFKNKEMGAAVCRGLEHLSNANKINKLLNTFIRPLQERADEEGRIHCSLNLNTGTGRLSSRNPNLQNQPALEKDIYKIRHAFTCRPGNQLIVADYGQLELRVLAHLTNCKSMIDAFEKGGDFHSRTAIGMYPEIKKELEEEKVLLEWDYPDGAEPPVPLIKNKYASERRKAKVLNFSIAYGKTAKGLSVDFGISVPEAEETLERWYADRPEVKEWQRNTIDLAKQNGFVSTLWGRQRQLPGLFSKSIAAVRAGERASINSPIQGSAADIVMAAMLKVEENEVLKDLGWKMVLQVHDEIIIEGPKESAPEAKEILVQCMQNPLAFPLRVELTVDASVADTWYEAK